VFLIANTLPYSVIFVKSWQLINKSVTLIVSYLKASAVNYSFRKQYSVNKTLLLKPGKGAAIWWVMEPHSTVVLYKNSLLVALALNIGLVLASKQSLQGPLLSSFTLGATTPRTMTLSITTFSIMALGLMTMIIKINKTRHSAKWQSIVILSVIYAEDPYAEFHYAECHYA
jgi:hypothetical protein